jgi:hypothetical protein
MPKAASPTNSAPATARAKIITFADFFFGEEGGLGPTVVVVVSLIGFVLARHFVSSSCSKQG